jgi:ribosomal protein S3
MLQDLETRHYIKILLESLGLSNNNLLIKNQNKSLFIYTKKITKLVNRRRRGRKKDELKRLLMQNNSILNVQTNFFSQKKLSLWEKKFFFSFTSANVFSEYVSNQIGLSARFRDDIFRAGIQNGILALMRNYFTNQNKFLISGVRISCKGKWSKTATGRTQKLVLTLGKLNTQTINSFIDYSLSTVATKFGACSVKVLISYKNQNNRF